MVVPKHSLSSHVVDPRPDSTRYTFVQWEQEDAQILSLMLSSMDFNIYSSLIHFDTGQDVWKHLKHMLSGTGNITRIYELFKWFFGLEQCTLGLEEYLSSINEYT